MAVNQLRQGGRRTPCVEVRLPITATLKVTFHASFSIDIRRQWLDRFPRTVTLNYIATCFSLYVVTCLNRPNTKTFMFVGKLLKPLQPMRIYFGTDADPQLFTGGRGGALTLRLYIKTVWSNPTSKYPTRQLVNSYRPIIWLQRTLKLTEKRLRVPNFFLFCF
jgi:hypothetical protein